MSDANAPSSGGHILIAGTGRAGTSFLVRYLTELGLDTELSRHGEAAAWDEAANAGLETVPLAGQAWDLPYVLKFPWTDQLIDQILDDNAIRLDTVILPVRDLSEAAMSRSVVELQALHHAMPWMTEVDQSWEMWGKTAGGVTFSLNPLDQGRLLAVGFHRLIERLIKADIPIVFLAFPRLVEDWEYLFQKLRPVLPATIDEQAARDAHQRASDPAKVRIGAELAAGIEGAGRAIGPVMHYASHQQLDAIAVRRELTRVREAAHDAAEASDRALQDVRAQADAAAEEGLELRRMLAGTLQALNDEKDRVAASERDVAAVKNDLAAAGREVASVKNDLAASEREVASVRNELAAAERHTAAVQQHLAGVQSELAGVQRHLAMVQRHLAAVQNHLNIILTSRSWRLTRPYRRFVEIVRGWRDPSLRQAVSADHLMVEAGIPEPVAEAEILGPAAEPGVAEPVVEREIFEPVVEPVVAESMVEPVVAEPVVEREIAEPVVEGGIATQAAPPSTGPSGRTADQLLASLTWTSRDNFLSRRFAFVMSVKRFDGLTRDGVVTLLKSRPLIEIYCKILGELAPSRVLEVGFFQGGMPLLLADLVAPEKFVGVDRNEPTAALTAMIEHAGLSQSIKLYGGISQSDPVTITQIVDAEFQGQPLDLIIDDASHEYENTKKTFEELFGYLRPGGKYVIEDWGWLHWPGEQWQTAKNPFWNQPAMTNLIFEIVMALATLSTATIAQIEVVSHACVIVTRGRALKHGARLDLEASRLACGRVYQLL